ncbi:hypothetical protein JOB18_048267 [Solea senegalensis]|uniref:Beta-1,3-galactosyl-O-glycosyl-glycoprotein beta-1,6-N-acetylglucosaminyltransferase 4-like n=1 Tax=Solea senegalensis TaxID=28829 RepID=A0AAV6R552_SOLSE|nr:beta-1,3-galactosyl-O-glycosyl-glycoprotein beta-1,6-N-acetylglucosaminyltransferase 4-like [Solea senegalensis]XP_043868740.1 beta-1,3-galactosyl-O-glycosyl-glycoprotein beta-1,6-N-acetylglucosaminyltransferase 4-like [Solea senegalensis]XP_043868741.1 beta-1,3-galactosyl-O-glycosyl-glycoprotein beta-1,6-N-acetylglucosaminyltransferase 4-like [Solea senegalensis]XP_043868742.1 beta-1,3-galactosyl-O-glycosyl-glycoprotein beta-1,6-N-acetylglucosaminyltransferase 4-like [Solea senegalensis]KAG
MVNILLKLRRQMVITTLSLLILCLLLVVRVKYMSITELPSPPAPVVDDVSIQTVHKYNISCSAIYDMDPIEVAKSLVIRRHHIVEDTDESLRNLTSDCPLFIKSRGYDKVCVTEEEREFPLAYSLVVHKSAWMVERLIRTLYTPYNIYCIHYDQKSSPQFIAAIKSLVGCFSNVFIASQLESVYYASYSRLKADLNCLSDLLASEVKWKYVINLCGQDFPLRSNIELVAELKKLNGANMLESSWPTEYKSWRFTFHHELMSANYEYEKIPVRTDVKKAPPPHGIQMFTGNAYFVVSRALIVYLNSSVVVKDFLAWSEDTFSPDEHFWATVVRLPGVPGEVPRSEPDITDLMSMTRLVKWQYLEEDLYPTCSGAHNRAICIFGAAELRWLLHYGHWFANKFDTNVDPIIIQCLEEKLEEKSKLFRSLASPSCRES